MNSASSLQVFCMLGSYLLSQTIAVPTLQEQLHKVQECIGEICMDDGHIEDVVNSILQLVNIWPVCL